MKPLELVGQKFGRLTAIERKGSKWVCHCDCGVTKLVGTMALSHGGTTSCGCYRREFGSMIGKRALRHGEGRDGLMTPEYRIWSSMKCRCSESAKGAMRARYYGRGIRVCDSWLRFENFLDDMGRRPSDNHSLDRIDNDAGYGPDNCRWATGKEQNRNKSDNRLITLNGVTQPFAAHLENTDLARNTVHNRLARGWTPERAFSEISININH